MIAFWYVLLSAAVAAYVVLDGFDLGAGTLHFVVAKNEAERRDALAAIGPYWDGNEVWLLAVAGTLFVAFPAVLAIALSGFYMAIFLVLWALLLRGMAIELRGQLGSPLWRSFWDACFAVSSAGLSLLFGIALGNLLRGLPSGPDGYFTLPLFTSSFLPRAPVGLVDAYTLGVGAVSVVALAHHGALFLAWKTAGAVNERARVTAARLFWALAVLLIAAFVATATVCGLRPSPLGVGFLVVALAALAGSAIARTRGRERTAFLASSVFLAGALGAVGATLFPTLLRSIDGAHDVSAYDAAAHGASLSAGAPWYLVSLLLVAGYFTVIFRLHRGKVQAADDPHS